MAEQRCSVNIRMVRHQPGGKTNAHMRTYWEYNMKAEFYDVKTRKKIQADVTEKVTYGDGGRKRYAFRAQTNDGRNLTKFVSQDTWKQTSL